MSSWKVTNCPAVVRAVPPGKKKEFEANRNRSELSTNPPQIKELQQIRADALDDIVIAHLLSAFLIQTLGIGNS